MMFGVFKEKKHLFRKRKEIPFIFVDDDRPPSKEPIIRATAELLNYDIQAKCERYQDFHIPDPIFDMICVSLGRDPIEERKELARKYWQNIKKVLDK